MMINYHIYQYFNEISFFIHIEEFFEEIEEFCCFQTPADVNLGRLVP